MATNLYNAFDRPYSPYELIQEAGKFAFPHDESIQSIASKADRLIQQIPLYEEVGNYQAAFLVSCRHSILCQRIIQHHTDYRDPQLKEERAILNENLRYTILKATELRPYLSQAYREYRLGTGAYAYPTPTSQIESEGEVPSQYGQHGEDVIHNGGSQACAQTAEPWDEILEPAAAYEETQLTQQTPNVHPPPASSRLPSPPPHPSVGTRPIHISLQLIVDFANAVSANTLNRIETCGILAGQFENNAWRITHIAIFDQTGNNVTCSETDLGSDQLLDFFQRTKLSVCGWIHTHPNHTCFLSSIDLHTQAAYQRENQSAIAIVVDPYQTAEKRQWDAYRVTEVGLEVVGQCKGQSGAFHAHGIYAPVDLYESVLGEGGHCVIDEQCAGEVVDWRKR